MRKMLVSLSVLVAALSGACGGSDSDSDSSSPDTTEASGPPVVEAAGTIWKPDELTADVGETVTWKWEKGLLHDLHIDGVEKVKAAAEATYEESFTKAGEYEYKCTLHSTMEGTLTVK